MDVDKTNGDLYVAAVADSPLSTVMRYRMRKSIKDVQEQDGAPEYIVS